jgi:hypothetical protein
VLNDNLYVPGTTSLVAIIINWILFFLKMIRLILFLQLCSQSSKDDHY